MKILQKTLCALSVMVAGTAPVWAADSTDLTVAGKLSPAACTPAFSGGGVVDYGTIETKSLTVGALTPLSIKKLDFSITCDEFAKIAFTAKTSRPDVVANPLGGDSGWGIYPGDRTNFPVQAVTGIGVDKQGVAIGGVSVSAEGSDVLLDGVGSKDIVLGYLRLGGAWQKYSYVRGFNNNSDMIFTFSDSGRATPKPFKTMMMPVDIQAFINKAEELDLNQVINLDGLITFELTYL